MRAFRPAPARESCTAPQQGMHWNHRSASLRRFRPGALLAVRMRRTEELEMQVLAPLLLFETLILQRARRWCGARRKHPQPALECAALAVLTLLKLPQLESFALQMLFHAPPLDRRQPARLGSLPVKLLLEHQAEAILGMARIK